MAEIKELQNPCAQCFYKNRDKNTGVCRKCLSRGHHLKYCMELGGLAESLPIDVSLVGHGGGSKLDMGDDKNKLPRQIYKMIVNVGRKHNVAAKNIKDGFTGDAFTRARFDIIKQYLQSDFGIDLDVLAENIGVSLDEAERTVWRIEND